MPMMKERVAAAEADADALGNAIVDRLRDGRSKEELVLSLLCMAATLAREVEPDGACEDKVLFCERCFAHEADVMYAKVMAAETRNAH